MLTVHQKKLIILSRLTEGDRIVRQRPQDCCPDAAWMLCHPQSKVSVPTIEWLLRRGYIAESIAPTTRTENDKSRDEMRRYYQGELRHRIYAITEAGFDWFLADDNWEDAA